MDNQRIVKTLGSLYRIVEAGERGYAVAASNVENRALKILFQTFVKQRADFKAELATEIQRLGGHAHGRSSFLGIVHRGRIDIFAALTIGAENVEKVVLKEVMIGERVALATYKRTLKLELHPDTRDLVQRQFEEVSKVVDQIRLMRGRNEKRMLVRLYDTKSEADKALRTLKDAGIHHGEIKIEYLSPEETQNLSIGRSSTILETVVSGAVGGAIWGTVAGLLAALGIFQMSVFGLDTMTPSSLLLVVATSMLGLMAGGAFVGGMIGLFIGWGIESEDQYAHNYTLNSGHILVRATVDKSLGSTVWQIMDQIAMEARILRANAHPV